MWWGNSPDFQPNLPQKHTKTYCWEWQGGSCFVEDKQLCIHKIKNKNTVQQALWILCRTSTSVCTGAVLSPNTPSVNLRVCHILLQKCLHLRTWEMDKLMSSPDKKAEKKQSITKCKVKWTFKINSFVLLVERCRVPVSVTSLVSL